MALKLTSSFFVFVAIIFLAALLTPSGAKASQDLASPLYSFLGSGVVKERSIDSKKTAEAESTFPQEWQAGRTSSAGGWVDVTFGNGLYAAVAYDGTIGTSTNGQRWRVVREGGRLQSWTSISYGGGVFVALAFGSNKLLYSSDGENWSEGLSQPGSWSDITYGRGQFLAVSAQGGMQASRNGQDWYLRMRDEGTLGRPGWRAVDYYQGQFVAVAEGGNGRVAVSENGWDWDLKDFEQASLSSVAAGPGKIVAGSYSGEFFFSEDDGESWLQADTTYQGRIADIIYAGGYFVAVTGSSTILYSQDGNTWEETNGGAGYLRSLALGSAGLMAIGNWGSGYGLYALSCCPSEESYEDTSLAPPVGVDWRSETLASDKLWRGIAYGNERFVSSSADGAAMVSLDGLTWSENEMPKAPGPYSLAFGEGVFVGVVFGSQESVWSRDGITWQSSQLAPARGDQPGSVSAWSDIDYANGKFIAVSTGGGIQTSPDGVTWYRRMNSGQIRGTSFRGVAYGNGTFLAVGESGKHQAYLSTDGGKNWTPSDIPAARWQSVAYGNGVFAAVSYNGDIAFSEDGQEWQIAYSNSKAQIYSVVFAGGRFLALASDTINIASSYFPQYLTRMISSENGQDWFVRAANIGSYPEVTYGADRFVTVSGGMRRSHVVGVSLADGAVAEIPGEVPEIPEEGVQEEEIPLPGEEVPGEEVPGEEVPGEEVPGAVPGEEVPGAVPGEEVPGAAPGEEATGAIVFTAEDASADSLVFGEISQISPEARVEFYKKMASAGLEVKPYRGSLKKYFLRYMEKGYSLEDFSWIP